MATRGKPSAASQAVGFVTASAALVPEDLELGVRELDRAHAATALKWFSGKNAIHFGTNTTCAAHG